MDVPLNLKRILFCTASLLQCFVSQLRTSSARKLSILENSKCIKSKTQLVLGKHGNVPVPHPVGSWLSAGAGRAGPGSRAGWAQLKSGSSKPGKLELSLCASLGWNGEIVSNSAGGVCMMEKGFICMQRVEEAVVLGMVERSCSSSLSIHTGWVMLGHLLARLSSRMFFVD